MAAAHVLMVDDERMILTSFDRVLRKAGHEVTLASSAAEALDACAAQRFDVIVSDIRMPGMTGVELLRQVRQRDLDVPVILMTAAPELETALAAIEHGVFAYLSKPFKSEALLAVIQRAATMHKLALTKREALELLGGDSLLLGDKISLQERFHAALGGLFIAFQPIVSVSRRCIVAYEALLRTTEETLKNPMAFLAAAERLGRLDELGRRVRGAVATAAASLPADVDLFVNLHPADLMDPELKSADAPLTAFAGRVVLEVTERASLEHVQDFSDRLLALRKLGYRIAVDDLGAGYAGLTSLTQLDPEVVKLDMSLVRHIDSDARRQRVVGSLVELCTDLSMKVVIEGVETAAELATLVALGGDIMQGYFFGKPMPGFAVVAFAERNGHEA